MAIPSAMIPFLGAAVLFVAILGIFVMLSRRAGGGQSSVAVDSRLSQFAGRINEQDLQRASAIEQIEAVVSKGKRGSQTARDLARADLKLTVTEFYMFKIGAGVLGAAAGALIGRASPEAMIISALVGFIVFSFIPDLYVRRQAGKRVTRFNAQLGDTINMMANSLRSGYSLLQSMELVSREAPQPTSAEFKRVVQEVGLGLATGDALDNLVKRLPSEDLDLLVTAVKIQLESGGNLAQILDSIGHTIRERIRIKGEIMVLTAQGRISAYVITGLPIALAIMITLINPAYMAPIFEFGMPPDAWCCLPVTSLAMITAGFFAIMKIVDIEI